jgi:hypothetical protein
MWVAGIECGLDLLHYGKNGGRIASSLGPCADACLGLGRLSLQALRQIVSFNLEACESGTSGNKQYSDNENGAFHHSVLILPAILSKEVHDLPVDRCHACEHLLLKSSLTVTPNIKSFS